MSSSIPAVFARGGTSKAVMFRIDDLPPDRKDWDAIFLRIMGSPDPSARQLDGMGGGVSSVSKVCIVGPPTRADADIDYLFAQVQVTEPSVDYSGNCGNMISAVPSFGVETGLLAPEDGELVVRIHNVNTGKIIRATTQVDGSHVVEEGSLLIPGVATPGAAIKLEFLDPGGATTGQVLPTGEPLTILEVDGVGAIEVSLVDVANACVFVRASDVGLTGTELPADLEANVDVLNRLAAIRNAASVSMGITTDLERAAEVRLVPLIVVVSAPQRSSTLSAETIQATDVDLTVRVMSNGQPHRASPLTGALCVAAAAHIEGSIPNQLANPTSHEFRLGMPSGVLHLGADVAEVDGRPVVHAGVFYRTSRRLFSGNVHYIPTMPPALSNSQREG